MTEKYPSPDTTNTPPTFVPRIAIDMPTDQTAFDQIIRINLSTVSTTQLRLHLTVREPDLEDSTEWRLFVDYDTTRSIANDDPRQLARKNDTIPPPRTQSATPELRDLPIDVPLGLFAPGNCHRVEVLASSAFPRPMGVLDPSVRQPESPGDIAQAVFWVAATDNANPTVDMGTCPQ